jgi:hypothetical protein
LRLVAAIVLVLYAVACCDSMGRKTVRASQVLTSICGEVPVRSHRRSFQSRIIVIPRYRLCSKNRGTSVGCRATFGVEIPAHGGCRLDRICFDFILLGESAVKVIAFEEHHKSLPMHDANKEHSIQRMAEDLTLNLPEPIKLKASSKVRLLSTPDQLIS